MVGYFCVNHKGISKIVIIETKTAWNNFNTYSNENWTKDVFVFFLMNKVSAKNKHPRDI